MKKGKSKKSEKKSRGKKEKRESLKRKDGDGRQGKKKHKELPRTYEDINQFLLYGKEQIVELCLRHLRQKDGSLSRKSFNVINVTRKRTAGRDMSIYVRFLRDFTFHPLGEKSDPFSKKAAVIFENGKISVLLDGKSAFSPRNKLEASFIRDRTIVKIVEEDEVYMVTHKFEENTFGCYEVDKKTVEKKLLWEEFPFESEVGVPKKVKHERQKSGKSLGKMFKKKRKQVKRINTKVAGEDSGDGGKKKKKEKKKEKKEKKKKKGKEKEAELKIFERKDKPSLWGIKNLMYDLQITPKEALRIIKLAAGIFKKEKNVLVIKEDPVNVIGDIHGQYDDLVTIFEIGGEPPKSTYLFLGDYVDRGEFGVECCLLLFTYKILYPNKIFLLRGNHETRQMTQEYNFETECADKFGEDIYDAFMKCFDYLPIAAILNEKFFCVHAGLSPDLKTVADIKAIERKVEPPGEGLYCDMLWSDPFSSWFQKKFSAKKKFLHNKARDCSYLYSLNAVEDFLGRNGLVAVIRAHGLEKEGFKFYRKSKKKSAEFPMVISVFSCPDYCQHNNKGAFVKLAEGFIDICEIDETNVKFDFFEEPAE